MEIHFNSPKLYYGFNLYLSIEFLEIYVFAFEHVFNM